MSVRAFVPLALLVVAATTGAASGELSYRPFPIVMEGRPPYYRPMEASVPSQAPIQWHNPTASPHTIRHDDCAQQGPCLFDSGAVPPDGSYTLPGLPPGRYSYHCELHPIMRGELLVGDPQNGPPGGAEGPVDPDRVTKASPLKAG